MNSLQSVAISVDTTAYVLPSGNEVNIPTWYVRFVPAVPARLGPCGLNRTYTDKPLVIVDDEALFGELAIARLLEKDGWKAVWADSFHRKFWGIMPNLGEPVELPFEVKVVYDKVIGINGGRGGCFDVVAWKGERIIWLEYKGPGDAPNLNEAKWIDAAIQAGIQTEDLFFVGCGRR